MSDDIMTIEANTVKNMDFIIEVLSVVMDFSCYNTNISEEFQFPIAVGRGGKNTSFY